MEPLKNCPHCGGSGHIKFACLQVKQRRAFCYFVECSACGSRGAAFTNLGESETGETETIALLKALESWNTAPEGQRNDRRGKGITKEVRKRVAKEKPGKGKGNTREVLGEKGCFICAGHRAGGAGR